MRIGVVASCQKLDIILENKVIKKLLLLKDINSRKCAPKFVFFNEKNEKDLDDFLQKKLNLKVQITNFVSLP